MLLFSRLSTYSSTEEWWITKCFSLMAFAETGTFNINDGRNANKNYLGVYYSLAVWRFKPILSAGLRFHSYLSGGLRLRNYRAVAGNHKFSSRFSVFACFCGGYSNRVKRLRRLSGNFIGLRKAFLFNKGLSFRARPCKLGLPSVPRPCGEGWGSNLI